MLIGVYVEMIVTLGHRPDLAHMRNKVQHDLPYQLSRRGVTHRDIAEMFKYGDVKSIKNQIARRQELLRGLTEGRERTGHRHSAEQERAFGRIRAHLLEQPGWWMVEEICEPRDLESQKAMRAYRDVIDELAREELVQTRGGKGNHDPLYVRVRDREMLLAYQEMSWPPSLSQELSWYLVHLIYRHNGPISVAELVEQVYIDAKSLKALLDELVRREVIQEAPGLEGHYLCDQWYTGLDQEHSWMPAVMHFFDVVFGTMLHKLRLSSGQRSAAPRAMRDDYVGASTYEFDLIPGDDLEEEVRTRLQEIREELNALHERTEERIEARGKKDSYRVVFFYGQDIYHPNSPREEP
jgi:hypothetical protein